MVDVGDYGEGGERPPFASFETARMAIVSLIQAEQTDNDEVVIDFLADFGNVTVTITDNSGRVHCKAHINTSKNNHLVVNIAALASGEYVLRIKNNKDTLNKSGKFFKVD
jgi:hypothetical protein